jgi:hypothetical protein
MASTLLRLEGKVPAVGPLIFGGSHVRNDAAYFLTGRAAEWLSGVKRRVKATLAEQRPDGSFRYKGKYLKGHFEDTASGHCAKKIVPVLEYAWITGDREAREAGLKTLAFMKRFRTPRGAQTWELSLHTPDILASAYLVWAYVRGYDLTGNREFLREARRWALSGIPFVYLWGNKPVMAYGTIAVYGATNYGGRLWIGLPVQWCGTVYAYALTMLAPHDKTLDWNHLAEGILIAAEQMQWPDNHKYGGCLPDFLFLDRQRRDGPAINPCALVSIRLALDRQVDSLAVAADGRHRVAAPYPVVIKDGKAHIQGKAGTSYQVLVDGKTVIDVVSKGADVVALE